MGTEKCHEFLPLELGKVCMTPAAKRALMEANMHPWPLILRHQNGDWGDLEAADKATNNDAARNGLRVMSSYPIRSGLTVWIITEADRSVTTVLLPSDY